MKKYLSLIYFGVIDTLSLFILFFVLFYGKNDLFKLPFNAGAWGTASDWMIILVTTATAYWLIRTFEEQKRANDIASSKDRREILPRFSIPSKPIYEEGSLLFSVVLNYNPANTIRFVFYDKENAELYSEPIEEMHHGNSRIFSLELGRASEFILQLDKSLYGEILFNDIDGNPYIQYIYIQNRVLTLSYPKYLKKSN